MRLLPVLFVASALGLAQPVETSEVLGTGPKTAKADAPEQSVKRESLHFNVNWPSGLSLGEGKLTSSRTDEGWSQSFEVDAAVPGFVLRESAKSTATAKGCSIELEKVGVRGQRKSEETTTFDAAKLTAVRKTKDGGKSELSISPCAKDAVTFFQHLRRELAAGRLPQSQKVYYGAAYQVTLRYAGTESIRIGGEARQADHLVASIKGPASNTSIDLYFARDAQRTPLLIQAPLLMGKFSLELAR